MSDAAADFLSGLTEPQRQAVEHIDGPLLILAAAGSGKTRVVTRRVAHLVSVGVPAWSILALTFTNKAAGEMRERIGSLLAGDPRMMRGLTVTTFHSLCARLLRRYADEAGLKPDFTIYDMSDQSALMKRVIGQLDMNTGNWQPRSVLGAISNAKNELKDAEAFAAEAGDYYSKKIAVVYTAYEKALRAANAVDFDDLLVLTAKMLREKTGVLAECHARWKYLMIDEYQDTNHAQFVIASMLAGEGEVLPGLEDASSGPNICVVGDPDQAIYGWRGADISNILDFEERYPGAQVIKLGENFRSTGPILGAADGLIKHNALRKDKPLFTTSEGGEPVDVVLCRDEEHEAGLVVDRFRRERDEQGLAWKDMAVLYRTNALSRALEDAFRKEGVPYVIARGTAFYEREEIKNAVAYLRVVANSADGVSLRRIVNTPTRGLGKASLDRIESWATGRGLTMMDGLRAAKEVPDLTARAVNASGRFISLIDGLTGGGSFMGVDAPGSLADLVLRVIKESGLEAAYEKQAKTSKSETDEERLENLSELVSSAASFEAEYEPESDPAAFPGADVLEGGGSAPTPPLLSLLRAYLESIALVADADAVDPAQGAVTLMTLHAAKGLEFPSVAVVGLEEMLLPHARAFDNEASLEEERRLFFVGMTRAMRSLLVTSTRYRTVRGRLERTIPSRFLEELPVEHIRLSDQSHDDGFDEDPY
ncbi:MAG: ATP-dependent DNA helicase PcrA, partial [Phycisphaerales bacterium]